MSEEKRATSEERPAEAMTAEQQAQHASDSLKGQIAALRNRVKNAQQTLSEHLGRKDQKTPKP